MKTFISIFLLSLMLMGCSNSSDKILAIQQETNAKIDSLVFILTEPEELTRTDVTITLFDSLVVYAYASANIATASADNDHTHIELRYVEYYVFYINKSKLYDGDYEFMRHMLPSSFKEFKEYESDEGTSPFIELTNPDIYQSYGKWRIFTEREIDMYRERGRYYSFRNDKWELIKSGVGAADIYYFHGRKFRLGNSQGSVQSFTMGSVYDLTSIKNGVFDIK